MNEILFAWCHFVWRDKNSDFVFQDMSYCSTLFLMLNSFTPIDESYLSVTFFLQLGWESIWRRSTLYFKSGNDFTAQSPDDDIDAPFCESTGRNGRISYNLTFFLQLMTKEQTGRINLFFFSLLERKVISFDRFGVCITIQQNILRVLNLSKCSKMAGGEHISQQAGV